MGKSVETETASRRGVGRRLWGQGKEEIGVGGRGCPGLGSREKV